MIGKIWLILNIWLILRFSVVSAIFSQWSAVFVAENYNFTICLTLLLQQIKSSWQTIIYMYSACLTQQFCSFKNNVRFRVNLEKVSWWQTLSANDKRSITSWWCYTWDHSYWKYVLVPFMQNWKQSALYLACVNCFKMDINNSLRICPLGFVLEISIFQSHTKKWNWKCTFCALNGCTLPMISVF